VIDTRALDALDGELAAALEAGLDQAAELAVAVARKAAGGGALAATIHVVTPGPFQRTITTSDPGATFVENGRGPAVAHGKAMHFVVNGTDVFRRSVGPAPARHFMAAAGAELEAHAGELLEQVIRRAT